MRVRNRQSLAIPMFGRSQEVIFQSYGRRRSRWRLPRWLVLLLVGVVAGAAAVITVQERYLPPRLSAGASAELRSAFEQADVERLRLRHALAESAKRLQTTLSERQAVADELAASLASTVRLRDDVAAVVAALPPDPRSGAVAVRAGRFTVKGGVLEYDVVLTRERAAGKATPGTLQLLVAGESGRGTPAVLAPTSIPMSLANLAVLRGSLPLPAGFKPRQTTIQVLDQPAGKSLGMRVMLIQ